METPVDRLKRIILSWDFWELDRRIVQQDLAVQDNLRNLPSTFADIQVHQSNTFMSLRLAHYRAAAKRAPDHLHGALKVMWCMH